MALLLWRGGLGEPGTAGPVLEQERTEYSSTFFEYVSQDSSEHTMSSNVDGEIIESPRIGVSSPHLCTRTPKGSEKSQEIKDLA